MCSRHTADNIIDWNEAQIVQSDCLNEHLLDIPRNEGE